MSLVSLKTELRQELKLTPQLLQSMEVLQMNAQELLEYLNRVTEENPVLEQEDSADLRHSYEELRQKASWLDGGVYGATFTGDPKEVVSIIVWLLMAYVFHGRLATGWRGRKPARLMVLVFGLSLFSIVVVNTLMETHHSFIKP